MLLVHAGTADAAQYDRLEKILLKACQASNHPWVLLPVLAELHGQQGQYDKSIADYRGVLAKNPRSYLLMNNLAVTLARSGQNLDEALGLANDALKISGPMADVLDSRAIVYIARKEYDKALEDLAAAVQDDKGSPEKRFHQAWAYSLAGKRTEASGAWLPRQDRPRCQETRPPGSPRLQASQG